MAQKGNESRSGDGLPKDAPRFRVQLGQFPSVTELIDALRNTGLENITQIGPYFEQFIPCYQPLCQDRRLPESGVVTPVDFGFRQEVYFSSFCTFLAQCDIGRPVREYGPLLTLKLCNQIKETDNCDMEVGDRFVVYSHPLFVTEGASCFWVIERPEHKIRLWCDYHHPGRTLSPCSRCLVSSTVHTK